MKIDSAAVEKIIVEVAAAEIMPRFRKLVEGDIEMKGINDPVTVADKAAERALIARLTSAFPGSVVVGEESFAKDPAILNAFATGAEATPAGIRCRNHGGLSTGAKTEAGRRRISEAQLKRWARARGGSG